MPGPRFSTLRRRPVRGGGIERDVDHEPSVDETGAGLATIRQDVRYALRLFRLAPAFTLATIATLALGIGANTAIFTIVNSLVLRSLPAADPARLAAITDGGRVEHVGWSYPIWEQIRQHGDLFDGAFAWSTADTRWDLASGGESQLVNGMFVSPSLFPTLGVRALIGRTLMPADDARDGGTRGAVAVISYAFWQRYFGGDADVVGRKLTIERIPFTIVGVTPQGFLGLDVGQSYDVAVPFAAEPLMFGPKESKLTRRSTNWLAVMVRLKRGQTPEDATRALRRVQHQIRAATLPDDWPARSLPRYLSRPFTVVRADAGRWLLRQQYERPLTILLVVVALVLLIACANIANLLLARASARAHEWAVRLALGASRWRLARQLLVESLVMAMSGAAGGVLIAQWGSGFLIRQLSAESIGLDLSFDWRVVAFTSAVTILAALIFGIAPALYASRRAPMDAVRDHGRATLGSRRVRVASSLVIAQVLLSTVLVVAAGLFVRTFSALAHVSLGFDTSNVLLVGINAQRSGIQLNDRLSAYEQIRERVLSVPGVRAAGVALIAPPTMGRGWYEGVDVSGTAARVDAGTRTKSEDQREAYLNAISAGWLSTYGTRLVSGRDFTEHDTASGVRVALVNEAFARTFLNGRSPLGHTVRTTGFNPPPPREIVGVVADAVYSSPRESVPPTMYIPLAQFDVGREFPASIVMSVRGSAESAAALTRSISAAITGVHPDVALTFRTLDAQVDESMVQERVLAILSTFFGTLALLMAAVGLYGVTSYAVSLRKTEIGIRMALGATRSRVVRLVLARVTLLIVSGIALGISVSFWASRFVAPLLYGIERTDTVTVVSAVTTLAAVGAIAAWWPAYRASRVNPATVLSDM